MRSLRDCPSCIAIPATLRLCLSHLAKSAPARSLPRHGRCPGMVAALARSLPWHGYCLGTVTALARSLPWHGHRLGGLTALVSDGLSCRALCATEPLLRRNCPQAGTVLRLELSERLNCLGHIIGSCHSNRLVPASTPSNPADPGYPNGSCAASVPPR